MQALNYIFSVSTETPSYNEGMKKISAKRQGIGARLTALRLEANLSQKELAKLVNVPIANIGFWERTNTPPSSKVLPRLASVLNTSVEEILTGKKFVRRNAPAGRVRETFDELSKLPRRQQHKILEVVDALIAQQTQKD